MREEIIEEVAKDIGESYIHVLQTGYEEEQHKFPITMCVIDFLEKLREKNIVYGLGDIFISEFIDKMYIEASNYKFSKAEFKTEKEALNYINILKKKYSFAVIDLADYEDYYINYNLLFKVIQIKPTRAIEKPKTLYLELFDKDEGFVLT